MLEAKAGQAMSERRELYRSPNGDSWFLGRADSTFIRWHLENKYDVDFERGLSVEQRAIGWMVEDHLYWALVDVRWSDDANFAKGPRNFSKKSLPPCVRS